MALWVCMGCKQAANQPPAQPQVQVEKAPATPIAEKKEELGKPTWDPEWDKIVEEGLPAEMLSPKVARAVRPFCPGFNAMGEADKRAYWAYFFQALSGAEAGLQPTADVRHTQAAVAVKDTVTKRMVRSEGLLQLTYMDADRYGCDFDWEKDKQLGEKDPGKTILQPKNNLSCGIKILHTQLIDNGKPLVWGKSYWSTLQPGTAAHRVFVKQMANVPDACKVAPAKARGKAAGVRAAGESKAAGAGTAGGALKGR
jgi:hypothetical protein